MREATLEKGREGNTIRIVLLLLCGSLLLRGVLLWTTRIAGCRLNLLLRISACRRLLVAVAVVIAHWESFVQKEKLVIKIFTINLFIVLK